MKKDPYSSLKFKNFRLYLSYRLLIILAIQIESLVVGWQIWKITGNPLSLGMAGLWEAIPAIAIALPAGLWADRYRRKNLIKIAMVGLVITNVILFVFSSNQEHYYELYGIAPLFLSIFISGISRGILGPSTFSFMSQMVTREHYVNSSTWNSNVWQMGMMLGPVMGGWLYALFFNSGIASHIEYCYLITIALIVVSFVFLSIIPKLETDNSASKTKDYTPMRVRLKEGISFVFGNKILLSAISLDLFAVLFGGAVALLPIFADEVLHVGAIELGMLRSAPAVGSACMAVFLAFKSLNENLGKQLLYSVAGFGFCMIFFALSRNLYLSLFLLFLSGIFDNVSVVIRSTLMQLLTPNDMRGRVSAVNSMFIGSSNEIGAFESGAAAKLLGLIPSVIFGGTMTLGVVFTAWFKAPKLKNLKLTDLT